MIVHLAETLLSKDTGTDSSINNISRYRLPFPCRAEVLPSLSQTPQENTCMYEERKGMPKMS